MGQVLSRNSDDDYQPLNDLISDGDVKAIKYKEIRKATKKFHHSLLLKERRFAYKGWIEEQNLTAVKPGSGIAVVVEEIDFDTSLHHEAWTEKINKLGQLRHPNLVKLIGYSFDTNIRIVVHEFIERGSLENHLFQREHECLSWETRMKMAKGAARGLAFLHGLEIPFMHGLQCKVIGLWSSHQCRQSSCRSRALCEYMEMYGLCSGVLVNRSLDHEK